MKNGQSIPPTEAMLILAKKPKKPAGKKLTTSNVDVLPTLADLTNIELKTKTNGISFLPTLLNQNGQKQRMLPASTLKLSKKQQS